MKYSVPNEIDVLNELKNGKTLSFFRHDPRYGLIDVQIYIRDGKEIVVSPGAEQNASEMESQFYSLSHWDSIWQLWGLEATIQADEYTLM
jgi:hypothetical protein